MDVTNAVYPPGEQFVEFFAVEEDGPFVMVNLLKFKERADYGEGSTDEPTGREAYERYGAEVTKLVEAGGGRLAFSGHVSGILLGEVEELWDAVALVEYPSHAAFQEMMRSPEWAAIEHHRNAGLAGQLNIRATAQGTTARSGVK